MFSRKKASKLPPVPCPNVLTPDKIPPFFIPPNLATLQGRRSRKSKAEEAYEGRSATDHIIQVENSEEIQADGHLHGASSMPQLSGLPFLPESPHTRRRESLFHGGQSLHQCHVATFSSPTTRPLSHPGLAPDSDTASSAETSPYSSPLLMRSLGAVPLCHAHRHRRRFTGRSSNVLTTARPSSLSTEETSSTDTSPSFPRREKESFWGCLAPPPHLPAFPLGWIRCHERLTKEVMLTVSKGGRLRLSSEYLQPQGRLRIRLVSAEAFYPSHCDPRHIHCCVSLRLRPGARQKQRSAIVKRSRDPIFNEDFFFEGVSSDELPRLSLRLKVLNKGSGMRRDTVLGECDVPLDSLLP
ncbi:C2 calcium-dependent domain-containing protein 4D [Sceloporus undulatus]|uniref:C2 calcium-dependent domain-containing protein 4D n=1 Tax=Sceloporus undulatus TaxID=8520 RepID=UPI001C4BC454|nr:C2 calcium-dependent domain-containing protein 4D [Sceloporus undulatus]XP_042297215.1 C2 calcium-dependent domain-containing protein 4D [Sceloporus undulatus]